MTQPLIAGLGPWEIIIIIGVLVLLFGAKKLPELARGTGQALRIFKAETQELRGDNADDGKDKSEAQQEIDARSAAQRKAEVQAEQERQTDTPS